ncbi:MAG TPA: tetratricopeptide repeat protein [Pirellulaceae bacterium]|nr:tetratricopeptide repeat protein [Pirellulaceae bacterium]
MHLRTISTLAWGLLLVSTTAAARAQDTVVITSADGKSQLTRQGEIVDYTGTELKLKTLSGREEPIAAGRVIEIKTDWMADHLRGRDFSRTGKLEDAVSAFQQAKEREKRPWARRQIMAELVECHAERGRFDQAGDEFLRIAAEDPTTPHMAVIPLPWRALPPDAALEARAGTWMSAGAKLPAAAVLGASWLLSTSRRGEAIAALTQQSLKRAAPDDPRLAMLADIQLWRTKIVTAKAEEVARWQVAIEKMPPEVQAVGWYVVGDARARLGQAEEASLAYLRVPLIHGRPRAMAADALVAAGEQLENLGRSDQAAGLYREVLADYPTCSAASEAQTRLTKLLSK